LQFHRNYFHIRDHPQIETHSRDPLVPEILCQCSNATSAKVSCVFEGKSLSRPAHSSAGFANVLVLDFVLGVDNGHHSESGPFLPFSYHMHDGAKLKKQLVPASRRSTRHRVHRVSHRETTLCVNTLSRCVATSCDLSRST
jgi:hypothetical protein